MANELIPSKDELFNLEKLAKYAVESKYFDKLGGYGGIFSIMMYAKEIGLSPMQALFGGMHSVLGKVELSPQQMNAMVRRAGHKIEIIDQTSEKCTLMGTRKDTGEQCKLSYTIEDAKKAGIYKENSGWTKYPSDMLFARAVSRVCRRLFPDVIGPSYVTGEIVEDKKIIDIEASEEEQSTITVETAEVVPPSREELIATIIEKTQLTDEMFKKYLDHLEKRCIGKTPSFYDVLKMSAEDPSKIIQRFEEWKCREKAA